MEKIPLLRYRPLLSHDSAKLANLLISSSGTPSWTPDLDSVPYPPGSTFANGTACVTRTASLTPSFLTVSSGALSPSLRQNSMIHPSPLSFKVEDPPGVQQAIDSDVAEQHRRIPRCVLLRMMILIANSLSYMSRFFADGASDSNGGYMSTSSGTYGLPTRSDVGVTVSGQVRAQSLPMFLASNHA